MRWFIKLAILILIDQLTKLAASRLGRSIFLNNQFAFSLPVPVAIMFLIYAAVLIAISMYVYKTWDRFDNMQRWAWAFVFAGGLSNVLERIILGYVRDFIPIANGVLNFADFYILFGLVLLLIHQRTSLRKTFRPEENNNSGKL